MIFSVILIHGHCLGLEVAGLYGAAAAAHYSVQTLSFFQSPWVTSAETEGEMYPVLCPSAAGCRRRALGCTREIDARLIQQDVVPPQILPQRNKDIVGQPHTRGTKEKGRNAAPLELGGSGQAGTRRFFGCCSQRFRSSSSATVS